jgi:hypothetical protein
MPSPTTEYRLTIDRVTGDPLLFKFQRSTEQIRNAGSAIEKGLAANYLGVLPEGKLVIIPSHQIASVEIDPAPKVFIQYVVKDVESVGWARGVGTMASCQICVSDEVNAADTRPSTTQERTKR